MSSTLGISKPDNEYDIADAADECVFVIASWVDLVHLLYIGSLFCFFFFVRFEYLRNMEECILTTLSQIQVGSCLEILKLIDSDPHFCFSTRIPSPIADFSLYVIIEKKDSEKRLLKPNPIYTSTSGLELLNRGVRHKRNLGRPWGDIDEDSECRIC